MRSFLLHIICIVALFSSCDWVNDDLSDCPTGTWLKISYTYNILNVDAASTQVGDITILAFDKNDKYVDRLDVDSITLHQGYCMVRLPFPEETYHLLIWGGISGYKKLNALFYSSLENITISEEYQVITAGLVKNTNYFSCILQDENNLPLRQEDFAFTLESTNGVIDYTNTPVGTTPTCYLPYRQELSLTSEQIPIIHARLNTLRIMKGDDTTLSIKHTPSGKTILHLPLTQYLLLSKNYPNNIGDISDQEYLDREDSYTLMFFIQSSDTGIPRIPTMKVNDWIIRLNDSELGS